MNPKEELRTEFGYYKEVSDGQSCVPWEDWEDAVWEYVQKLEQEVLKLRGENLAESDLDIFFGEH